MSSGSAHSLGSAWSHGSRNSLGSLTSLNSKKERRRRRRLPTRTSKQLDNDSSARIFHCTFCTDRFKSKYDWSRHEKSLHLSLEKWICAPLGDVITCSSSGQRKCTYCDALDPSKEHLDTHNHRACEEKGLEARTFYRKDHLRQHLRLMHGCKMTASMESWKAEAQFIKSRCGFCGMDFEKWQDRVDHLAKEFRNGANIKNWKGCRGLDAHVAALVTNAMPPYLIANESNSPFPFSATNSASMKHHNLYLEQTDLEYVLPSDTTSPTTGTFIPHHMGDVSMNSSNSPTTGSGNTPQITTSAASPHPNPNATCWEILTLRLGRFARQYIEQNGPNSITDEVLQQQARYILYDSDDPWNQTAADNVEWLTLFKKAHGIDNHIPYPGVISPHEILEDLGIRQNTYLDPSFNLNNFENVAEAKKLKEVQRQYECTLSGGVSMVQLAQRLALESNFTLPELSSTATTASNIPATTFADLDLDGPISELTCGGQNDLCLGEDGEFGIGTGTGTCTRLYEPPKSFLNTSTTAPIQELPCTMTGESLQDHFALSNWDQLQGDFGIPTTTAGMSASLPVSSRLGEMNMSDAEIVQSNLGHPQVMRWDDSDLTFNLDMDIDIDTNVDLIMGTTGADQHR